MVEEMNKSLVIFDVDGTLTRTLRVDAACFTRAFADEFGVSGINTDWGYYDSYTDSGIAAQIFRERLGHHLSPEESARLVDRFMALLREEAMAEPGLFQEVPGAAAALGRLRKDPNWQPALATGCWLASALFKLEQAGISRDGIPLATADDSPIREEIARLALARSRSFYRVNRFERVVYVGDGAWDVKMAAELRIAFVGIADREKSELLRAAGAARFRPDFRDYPAFLEELSRAVVPGKQW
jgi:phosphoglycolate phosphatase-like HAD superfamily hydrolase